MSLALFLHLLSATVWVGGMFFALAVLRPSLSALAPASRLALWEAVLTRFFRWVGLAVVLLLASGLWLTAKRYGGIAQAPLHVHGMFALGIVMMLAFAHALFAPFRRLRMAVAAADIDAGSRQLRQIRWLVSFNLALGIAILWLVTAGRTGLFL